MFFIDAMVKWKGANDQENGAFALPVADLIVDINNQVDKPRALMKACDAKELEPLLEHLESNDMLKVSDGKIYFLI